LFLEYARGRPRPQAKRRSIVVDEADIQNKYSKKNNSDRGKPALKETNCYTFSNTFK